MNIENIKGIMDSKIWKKIISNKGYRGYTIIDTKCKPNKRRLYGSFFVLLVFFSRQVKDKTILKYHLGGCRVPKREGSESLDMPQIHKFYGTMKMVNFS